MPDIKVNVEVYCARCKRGLCQNVRVRQPGMGQVDEAFEVEPCARCEDAAVSQALAENVFIPTRDEGI